MFSRSEGEHEVSFELTSGTVDGAWLTPAQPRAALLLSHGAGAPYNHATMQALAEHFASVGLASLRYNFPYMQQGKRRVDRQDAATLAVAEAAAILRSQSDLPSFLAGHSFGGRMSGHAVVDHAIDCCGLIFCSYPLHPPKKPGIERAARLVEIDLPMLFLSGTRDDLADQALLQNVVEGLASARLHWLDTGNHSYVPLKRSRKDGRSVFEEMAEVVGAFVDEVL